MIIYVFHLLIKLISMHNLQPFQNHKSHQSSSNNEFSKTANRNRRKRSPDFRRRKQAKINKIKETEWNNRFATETVPFFINYYKMNQKRQNLRGRRSDIVEIKMNYNKKKVDDYKIRNIHKNKIVVLDGKENQNVQGENDITQKALQLIGKSYKELQYSLCHRNLLLDLIKNSQNKELSFNIIENQIQKIRKRRSSISFVQGTKEQRQKYICELKEVKQRLNYVSIDLINKYRESTLQLIENILKWKEQWESIYLSLTKIKISLIFQINHQNYFEKMAKSVEFMHQKQHYHNDLFLLQCLSYPIDDIFLIRIRAAELFLLEDFLCQMI